MRNLRLNGGRAEKTHILIRRAAAFLRRLFPSGRKNAAKYALFRAPFPHSGRNVNFFPTILANLLQIRAKFFMPLVTTTEMFKKAYAGGYAVGAFNVNDMEMIQAIVEAANELNSPVILQVSAGARKYANPVYLRHLVEAAVETTNIPIAMHLDHGADFEICKASIDGGFTSVMIDASSKPWEENIAITKKVVEYAHDHGVVVEAELGKLAGIEDDVNVAAHDAMFTSPDEVEEFTARTGIDSLAIAIGTSHGAYKFKPGQDPKLRIDILEEVGRRLKLAVCKINIDSDLRVAFTAAVRKHLAENPSHFDPRQYLGDARANMKELVKHKITDVLGSANKA